MSLSTSAPDLRQRTTFSIGVMIALSSWALIFFTLVWGYMVYRLRATAWLGNYLTVPVKVVADLNTVIIVLSSVCLMIAFKKHIHKPIAWVWNALGLGVIFLIGQFYLWHLVMATGLHWQSSIAGSFFFVLTGFHAVHIIGALVALAIMGIKFDQWQGTSISLGVKYFWDFLCIVWLIMFMLIFIVQ